MDYKDIAINKGIVKSLSDILFLPSPNFSHRNQEDIVKFLVIHCISLPKGNYSGFLVEQLFRNYLPYNLPESYDFLRDTQVSAHIYIKRTGKIVQFVNLNDIAWHAGVSYYDGVKNLNPYSIGIELEGADDDIFTKAQYDVLIKLTKAILKTYPEIQFKNIVGHSDIAPDRKTDPGKFFDWDYYKSNL